MKTADHAVLSLRATLAECHDPAFAAALQRCFPDRVEALGVRIADVVDLANAYLTDHPALPEVRLEMAELLLGAGGVTTRRPGAAALTADQPVGVSA